MDNAASILHEGTGWNLGLEFASCERCHWSYLTPASRPPGVCPNCCQPGLTRLPVGQANLPFDYRPELVLPFALSETALREKTQAFARGIPFAPKTLTAEHLSQPMTPVYLPVWLVDGRAQATWEAETGYDYRVVSHQESYSQDALGWQTREVQEERTRWQPRAGRLNRVYQNVSAPALAAAAGLEKALDGFEREKAEAYCPDHLESVTGGPAMVRLPDQSPADAWSEAAAAFQRAAMEECRTACGADRIRQFRWKAQFSEQAWTLLLLPVYASYYEDDSGQPQQVFIHGRTGEISGARRASLRRAKQTSLSILLAGVALLVTGLILFLLARQSLAELAFLLLLGGMLGVAGSLAPLGIAWEFNRQQKREGEGYRKAF